MLKLLIPQTAYILLRDDRGACACSLGVLQEKHLGLFDIVVDERARRRGHGRNLVGSLLAWGKAHGADTAYLQVIANNTPARKLYEQFGFVEQYNYWYRVRI
jgi:ribosomal protein S18 acetylase RimI-like enzyme